MWSVKTKEAVYAAYGITRHFNGTNGELDHLVSLELGAARAATTCFRRRRYWYRSPMRRTRWSTTSPRGLC